MDDLAQVFLSKVVARYGVPKRFISNCNPHFVSAFWKGFMSALGAQIALFTAYHTRTDKQSEQQHQSLSQILRCFVSPW